MFATWRRVCLQQSSAEIGGEVIVMTRKRLQRAQLSADRASSGDDTPEALSMGLCITLTASQTCPMADFDISSVEYFVYIRIDMHLIN
jgi:hypothetical protein